MSSDDQWASVINATHDLDALRLENARLRGENDALKRIAQTQEQRRKDLQRMANRAFGGYLERARSGELSAETQDILDRVRLGTNYRR